MCTVRSNTVVGRFYLIKLSRDKKIYRFKAQKVQEVLRWCSSSQACLGVWSYLFDVLFCEMGAWETQHLKHFQCGLALTYIALDRLLLLFLTAR